MPSYAWSCPACATSNAPQALKCRVCGCSALASVSEIEAARKRAASQSGEPPPPASGNAPYASPSSAVLDAGADEREKPGALPYVIAGISYIPLLGVLFGIVAVIWGLTTSKARGGVVAAIGAGGIAFTVLIYGSLFYFGFQKRGGAYDEMRVQMSQSTLNSLVPSVEFYKVQYGSYPASLADLQKSLPKGGFVTTFDMSSAAFAEQPKPFFYKLADSDHYYLRGVGADGKPFTADDVLPKIPVVPGSKMGLLTCAPDAKCERP